MRNYLPPIPAAPGTLCSTPLPPFLVAVWPTTPGWVKHADVQTWYDNLHAAVRLHGGAVPPAVAFDVAYRATQGDWTWNDAWLALIDAARDYEREETTA
jgi:hypothetical protein